MNNSLVSCESFLSEEDLSQGGVEVRSRTLSSRTKRSGNVNRSDVFANEMMTSFRITRRSTLSPEDLMRQSSQTTAGVPLRRWNSTNSSSSIHSAEGANCGTNDVTQNIHEMMNASTASLALEDLCMNLNKSLELSTGQESFNSISSRPLHSICERGKGLRGGGDNGSSGSEEPSVSSVKDAITSDDENAGSELDRHSSWQRRVAVFRVSCGNFVNSTPIQIFMSFLLVSNGIVLGALTFDTLPPDTRRILEYTDIITLIAFTIEISLHGIYLGLRQLFKDGWLTFDFFVILFSWCFEGSSFSVLRSFRIFRVFSVISRFENLKTLFEAIGSTIPRMASIWLSLLLFFYVFCVLFTSVWSGLFRDGYLEDDYFGNLGQTFVTLFQVMTLDNWTDVARQVMSYEPWAFFGFFVFILFSSFFIINLVVAVMCESLIQVSRSAHPTSEDSSTMSLRGDEDLHSSPNIAFDGVRLEIMMRQMLKNQGDMSKSIVSIRTEIDYLRKTNIQDLATEKHFSSMPSFVEFVSRSKSEKGEGAKSRKDKCLQQLETSKKSLRKERVEKVKYEDHCPKNDKENKCEEKRISRNSSLDEAKNFSESTEEDLPSSLQQIHYYQPRNEDDSEGKESLLSESDSVSHHFEYTTTLKGEGDSEQMDSHDEEEDVSKDYVLPLDFKTTL